MNIKVHETNLYSVIQTSLGYEVRHNDGRWAGFWHSVTPQGKRWAVRLCNKRNKFDMNTLEKENDRNA